MARTLSIFQYVPLAIAIAQAATWAAVDLGGGMIKVLSAFELIVAQEHGTSATGGTQAGRLVVFVVVGGLPVAKDAEKRTESCDVADHHSNTILGESPDDDICDSEKVVGLAGKSDCVF